MTWHRLLSDIPVPVDKQRALITLDFEDFSLKVFEQTAISADMNAKPEQLCGFLREKICNKSHIISLRSQVMRIKLNGKKEFIPQYAYRLRTKAMNLPDTMSDDMLTDFFMEGLLSKLRSTALNTQGGSHEVVSRTSLIASDGGIDHVSVRPIRILRIVLLQKFRKD